MNIFNDKSVAFLEDSDVDDNGHLNVGADTAVVMLMGNYCGHCKTAAPEYHKFALKNKNKALIAAVLLDGEESEKALGQRMDKIIPGFRGVPTFVIFKNGQYKATHDGSRTAEDLEVFLNNHL